MSSQQTDMVYDYMHRNKKYYKSKSERQRIQRAINISNELKYINNLLRKRYGYLSKFARYLYDIGLYKTQDSARSILSQSNIISYGYERNDTKKQEVINAFKAWRELNPEEDYRIRISSKSHKNKNIEKHIKALDDYWKEKGLK